MLRAGPWSSQPARYWGRTTVGFSCSFNFRPVHDLLNPEPGGGQGNMSTNNVAQVCLLFRFVIFVLQFQVGTSPSRGAVGSATFPFHVFVAFSPPPQPCWLHAGGFGLDFPYHSAHILPSVSIVRVFPGCRCSPLRDVRVDFEWALRSRFFDSCSSSWNRSFPDFLIDLVMLLVRVLELWYCLGRRILL